VTDTEKIEKGAWSTIYKNVIITRSS